ncbi:hydrophobe/amphiphile efflux-1 (HAE1) family protein [Poseidonocella pacifica]|uniref:Hydrophobe/amphiphile efflux-1 (HAE1) family protein n=1 Tax=Poseidonocella pacifica TaxID=871651 RepID=A0A1I0WCQ4_9RHOB|nr:efflux RND transporter permease subunit [Poseidonocella pacifica]SFA86492.1 hydrophobe/amphiphile efflux-1 (HAE1) family protein [Poseidonocella pacifica]
MSLERQARKAGFADIFVARPIFGIVLNLLVIIAGLAALSSVDVREMPDVDQPVLSVRTDYEGAVPSTVDTQVTQVLEDALSALEGLSYIESESASGSSRITIDLSDGTDVDVAANEAREIVSNTMRSLPDDVDDPTVSKSDSNSDAIIRLALLGDASFDELTRLAEGAVYEKLSTIDGIAEVTVRGNRANEFRVTVDIPSLMSRGLTVFDVNQALSSLRDDTPLGELESTSQTLALSVGNEDVTVDTIKSLRINAATSIADVALVQLLPEESTVFTRVNGQSAVSLDITRQSVGNTLDISRAVSIAVEELQAQLPQNVQLVTTSDDGIFIEGSIQEVVKSILLATCIVIAVIFLFLRSVRATLIPAVTIPVALIGTLAAIWLAGFSVNTISLLAMVLATGMVVDDAIVVIENIVRKRKSGMGAYAAAAAGTNEVFFAVISTTATLAAVFIPISFLPGQAGGVFSEFGFVLAFAVTLSSATALTLAPVLAALLDPGKPGKGAPIEPAPPTRFARGFDAVMDWAIRTPLFVLAVAIAFAIIAFGAASSLPSAVTPSEDRGFFLVQARGASDTTVDYLDEQVAQIEEILAPYQDRGEIRTVQSIVGIGGGTSAFIIVRLPDWQERDFAQQDLITKISGQLNSVPGVQVSARSTNSLNIRGAGSGLGLAVTGTDIEDITAAADALVAAMSQDPTFLNPQLSNDSVDAQLEVTVDDDAANDMGLSPSEVTSLISVLVRGNEAVTVFQDDTEIAVNVVPGGPPIDDPSDIESMSIRLDNGSFVPLSTLATLETVVSQAQIERHGGALSVALQANLGAGADLSDAMSRAQQIAQEVLPEGMALIFTGEAATLDESNSSIYVVFGVALLVVLLVLAAQFESFASAVVIMMTVPFGLAAAILAISITGGSLNYYSQIGLVMLIGVMAKNGILIVEFANQLREAGEDIDTAIRSALRLRIRPVMMTMVSTVFGGLPLVLTSGAGAEARVAVGWVIVGGLGFATVFTLFLTPIFYRWIAVWGAEPGAAASRLRAETERQAAQIPAE